MHGAQLVTVHCGLRFGRNKRSAIPIDIVVVAHPAIELHISRQFMGVAPPVLVAHISMIEVHITIAIVLSEHQVGVFCSTDSAVMIGRSAAIMSFAVHHHAADGEVVLLGEMPSKTHTGKEVMPSVFALAIIALILIGLLVVLVALAASLVLALAEPHIGISIEYATGVIDVATRVPSAVDISTST